MRVRFNLLGGAGDCDSVNEGEGGHCGSRRYVTAVSKGRVIGGDRERLAIERQLEEVD